HSTVGLCDDSRPFTFATTWRGRLSARRFLMRNKTVVTVLSHIFVPMSVLLSDLIAARALAQNGNQFKDWNPASDEVRRTPKITCEDLRSLTHHPPEAGRLCLPRRPHDGRNRQEIGARLLWRVTITRLFRRLFHGGGAPRLDRGARVQPMDSLAGPRKRPPGISALRRKFLSVHGLSRDGSQIRSRPFRFRQRSRTHGLDPSGAGRDRPSSFAVSEPWRQDRHVLRLGRRGAESAQGVEYYEQVSERMGPSTSNFFRLFMVPAMFHCDGGVGVSAFDAMTPLVRWVEKAVVPERIIGSRIIEGKTI